MSIEICKKSRYDKESVTLTEILWKKREIWKATDSRKEEM